MNFTVLPIHLTDCLPCPFCGSSRIVKGERYFALCVDCGATGPERTGDKGGVNLAKKDWNSRVPEPAAKLNPPCCCGDRAEAAGKP